MKAERLTEPGAVLGEGPVWDSGTGTLLWVDIIGQRVHRTLPGTGLTETIETPSAVGAIALDRDGGLVASLVDGVYRHLGAGWSPVAAIEADMPENRANESKCDPFGNYLVGTMPWTGDRPVGALYRLYPDHTVQRLRTGLTIANGLAWWDEVMWHIDTPTSQIVGFRYSPSLDLGERAGVIDVAEPGHPDGMCVDAEGLLWVAMWGAGVVRRYTREGRPIAEIEVPATQVSSCAFGGDDLSLLFITTATENLPDPTAEPEAGAVFVVGTDTRGLEPDRFAG
jgi:sugar lactone lactonase YvrE